MVCIIDNFKKGSQMGVYLGVNAVKKLGSKINVVINPDKQPSIASGQRLIAIVDNAIWAIAPDVTSADEFRTFANMYKKGDYSNMTLYLLLEAKVGDCRDEGRVYLE